MDGLRAEKPELRLEARGADPPVTAKTFASLGVGLQDLLCRKVLVLVEV